LTPSAATGSMRQHSSVKDLARGVVFSDLELVRRRVA
jgi:hypothetical protein